jgi:predicted nucleotidyltransferase
MQEVLAQARVFFESDTGVKLALVFGSFVKGRVHSGSDLDVAVAYSEPLTFDQRVDLAQALSAKVKREVDLVDLRGAHGLLLQEILTHRKTLVNRDGELYGNIVARRLTEESDLMPLIERVLNARRERFIHGTKGS